MKMFLKFFKVTNFEITLNIHLIRISFSSSSRWWVLFQTLFNKHALFCIILG